MISSKIGHQSWFDHNLERYKPVKRKHFVNKQYNTWNIVVHDLQLYWSFLFIFSFNSFVVLFFEEKDYQTCHNILDWVLCFEDNPAPNKSIAARQIWSRFLRNHYKPRLTLAITEQTVVHHLFFSPIIIFSAIAAQKGRGS